MVAAASAAAKVQHAFDTPFSLDDGEVRSGASIGIALYPSDAADVDALIQCADHAMYRSKRGGRRRTTFYGSQ
jgi:GGDEF domain-containing protein